MFSGTHPWPNLDEEIQIFFKLINLKENEMPEFNFCDEASNSLKSFLNQTFITNYLDRPTAIQLLQHEFAKINV